MDIRKLSLCFLLILGLLAGPALGSDEEEFDPEPWESVEALSSLEDVSSRVGAKSRMSSE